MRNPELPGRRGRSRWPVLLLAGLLTGTAAHAAGPPSSANVETGRTERLSQTPTRTTPSKVAPKAKAKAAPRRGPARRPAAKAAKPATPVRELKVTTDVPGAMVFLDRKYLGTTPLVSPDITAGSHELNVQVEGKPPVVQSIEVAASGATEINVAVAAAAVLDLQVAVVHEHGRGECEGVLRATPEGLRYDTPHKDAFTVPFANLETFSVDYEARKLRVKARKGKSYTFTTRQDTADPLFVFHRDVEARRPR
ncbi:MAG TPA: PEGA domain-containing protein [Luteitalea sp.]|nr:PEGA domain-containing protein [Luteitalea sp.]